MVKNKKSFQFLYSVGEMLLREYTYEGIVIYQSKITKR